MAHIINTVGIKLHDGLIHEHDADKNYEHCFNHTYIPYFMFILKSYKHNSLVISTMMKKLNKLEV